MSRPTAACVALVLLLGCGGESSKTPTDTPSSSTPAPAQPAAPAAAAGQKRPSQGPTRGGPPLNVPGQNAANQAPALPQPDPGAAPQAPVPDTTGCDAGMVRVQGADGPFCIHQYEVHIAYRGERRGPIQQHFHEVDKLALVSEPGHLPTRISFLDARRMCEDKGYHLCTSAEWEDACDNQPGEGGRTWSTLDPDRYRPGACNYTHTMKGGTVPLAEGGSYPWCVTESGVYDLLGNIWEWSDPGLKDDAGQPIIDKRGGSHYGRHVGTCSQTAIGTHPPTFYASVGFRCCGPPAK